MTAFKGRLNFRQYMPAKPTKYGIKVWMAADASNGYVVNLSVNQGSEGEESTNIHGLGYEVVMNMARPYLNRKHHLFFDNVFSTPRLFDHLELQDTYVCATVRSNRKELPPCVKTNLKQPGEIVCSQRGHLLYTKWHDKRDINFLSSNVSPGEPHRMVKRKVKKKEIEIPKPFVADLYTSKIGGVDQADQLRSYYYTGRQTKKWYRYLWWFLVNVCVCNGHILESIHRGNNKRSQLQFRFVLAKQLIKGFSQRKRPVQGASNASNRRSIEHTSVRIDGRKKTMCALQNCWKKNPERLPKRI